MSVIFLMISIIVLMFRLKIRSRKLMFRVIKGVMSLPLKLIRISCKIIYAVFFKGMMERRAMQKKIEKKVELQRKQLEMKIDMLKKQQSE
jgi:hypothetical protein